MSIEEKKYIGIIKANYAGMANDSLSELWTERHGLTGAAYELLEQELERRGLINGESISTTIGTEGVDVMSLEEKYSKAAVKGYWQLITSSRLDELPEDIIAEKLVKKGLTEAEAIFMIKNHSSFLLDKINDADSDRLGALIRLCCGIAVLVITLLATLGNGIYFIGWITIALSIVQTAIASSKKSRLQSLLITIAGQAELHDGEQEEGQ